MDFEVALANGVKRTFPDCKIWRDYFHLKQANFRKLKKLGLESYRSIINTELGNLFDSKSEEEFSSNLDIFKIILDEYIPQYIAYFEKTYIKKYTPETWSKFGRPSDVPSGLLCLYTISH